MDWEHNALAEDLAASKRRSGHIVQTKLSIGTFRTHGEMDLFFMRPSWTDPAVTCVEVKISRSDFLADVTSGKYTRYRPFCRFLYFAVPKGMVKRDEIPPRIGLYERGEEKWRTVKRATAEDMTVEDHFQVLKSLVMRHHNRPIGPRSRADRIRDMLQVSSEAEYLELWGKARVIGENIANEVSKARREAASCRQEAAASRMEKRDLAPVLGITEDEAQKLRWWNLADRVSRLQPRAPEDQEKALAAIEAAIRNLAHLKGHLEGAS
jgi:DNA repair protein MmcB-like